MTESEETITYGGVPLEERDLTPVPDPAPAAEPDLGARIDAFLNSPAGAIGRRAASRQERGTAIELLREARARI